ncbi:MAG: hypothetical protein ACOH2A_11955 [Sphingobacteriaceae bacterium]
MKKLLIILILSAGSIPAFAQQWKKVEIDTLVSVLLPDKFQKKDTLNQQLFSTNGSYGAMIVIRSENSQDEKVDVKRLKDLNKLYDNYIKKVQGSAQGTIESKKDTLIEGLNAKDFVLKTDTGSGVELRYFRVLFTQDATYTFEYLVKEIRTEFAQPEYEKFFNSIKIGPEVTVKADQLAEKGATSPLSERKKSFNNTLIYGGVGFIVLIIILVVLIRRKKRN